MHCYEEELLLPGSLNINMQVCVCVCVVQVYLIRTKCPPNDGNISEILVFVGTIFGPHEESSL